MKSCNGREEEKKATKKKIMFGDEAAYSKNLPRNELPK